MRINDSLDSAYKFREIIGDLGEGIKKIHINTAVRPSGGDYMKLPLKERIQEIKNILGKKTELIGKVDTKKYNRKLLLVEKEIMELLKRRPSGMNDISQALGININETIKIIDKLFSEEKIIASSRGNIKYYFISEEKKA